MIFSYLIILNLFVRSFVRSFVYMFDCLLLIVFILCSFFTVLYFCSFVPPPPLPFIRLLLVCLLLFVCFRLCVFVRLIFLYLIFSCVCSLPLYPLHLHQLFTTVSSSNDSNNNNNNKQTNKQTNKHKDKHKQKHVIKRQTNPSHFTSSFFTSSQHPQHFTPTHFTFSLRHHTRHMVSCLQQQQRQQQQ